MYVFYWRTRPIHALTSVLFPVTSLVVLFRDAPTQFKKVGFNSVDCKRCHWCMGPGPDLESPTKREKQLTRCPRSSNVSWLVTQAMCRSNSFSFQILIESLHISSFASAVYLVIGKYPAFDIPYVCLSR